MNKRELVLFLQSKFVIAAIFFMVFTVSIFFIATAGAQSSYDIKITEIMFDPPNFAISQPQDAFSCSNDSSCQWIEIYNNENFAVDLSQWKVKVETKTDGIKDYDFANIIIQPKNFLVIATQLEDEDSDSYSFARIYGNKDGYWDPTVDGFNAVDSNVPFFATPDLFPGLNTFEHIELKNGAGEIVASMIFFSYYTDPIDVQKNNGYTMERNADGKYVRSMKLGGSPGGKRNTPPQFSTIPNITIQEDYDFQEEVLNVTQNQKLDLRNYATDSENDALSFQVIQQTSQSLISCSAVSEENSQSFIKCANPAQDQNGFSTITIEASDGLSTSTANFTIFVQQVNDQPQIISTPQTTETTATIKFQYQIQATDAENDTISYSLLESPGNTEVNSSTGLLTFTPTESQLGINRIKIKASGPTGDYSTQEIEVKVKPILEYEEVILKHGVVIVVSPNNTQVINLVKANEEIELLLTTINNHPRVQGNNVRIEDVHTAVTLLKGDEVILQNQTGKEFNLDSLASRQENFSFTMPRDLESGTYNLKIETTGILVDLDDNLQENVQEKEISLNLFLEVSKNRHDVYISNIREVQQAQTCTDNTTLEVILTNSGTASEQNIELNVFNEALNISQTMDLPRLNPSQSHTAQVQFKKIPGEFNIQASVVYNNGESFASKNFMLTLPCLIGDFDRNSCIDEQDNSLFFKNLGAKINGENSIYNFNSDGVINFEDFFIFSDNYGKSCELATQQQQTSGTQTQNITLQPTILKTGITIPSIIEITTAQGTTSTKEFQITNNNEENSTLVSFSISGLFTDNSNQISFILPQQKNILSNSTEKFILTVTTPANMDDRDYSGFLEVKTKEETKSANLRIQVGPKLCSSGVIGDLDISTHKPDNNDKFEPGESIPIDFSVRNNGQKKDVSAEIIIYNLDEDDEIETESIDDITISSFSSERKDFETEIDLPNEKEIGEDDLAIIIKAFEEGNEDKQCSQQIIPIKVDRQEKDVKITSFNFPQQAVCNSETKFSISVENQGENNDKEVYIMLKNKDLSIDLKSNAFELKDVYETKNKKSQEFFFTIPVVQPGQYPIEASISFDEGKSSDSEIKTLQVECEEAKSLEAAKKTTTGAASWQGLMADDDKQVINSAFELSKILSIIVASLIVIGSLKILILGSSRI